MFTWGGNNRGGSNNWPLQHISLESLSDGILSRYCHYLFIVLLKIYISQIHQSKLNLIVLYSKLFEFYENAPWKFPIFIKSYNPHENRNAQISSIRVACGLKLFTTEPSLAVYVSNMSIHLIHGSFYYYYFFIHCQFLNSS